MGQSGLSKSWLNQSIFYWLNWFTFLRLNWFIFHKWANLGLPKISWNNSYFIDWINSYFFGWTDSYFINGPIWALQKLFESFIFDWLNWFIFLLLNWFIFHKWANLGFPKVGWNHPLALTLISFCHKERGCITENKSNN